MRTRERKRLIKIAHSYNVRCHFHNKKSGISYASVRDNKICIWNGGGHSTFFHELGHIIDYRNNVYKQYYKANVTKKVLRRYAVLAEIHTDYTGQKLMRKYFPYRKYYFTYKYKKWQKWLKEYWGI